MCIGVAAGRTRLSPPFSVVFNPLRTGWLSKSVHKRFPKAYPSQSPGIPVYDVLDGTAVCSFLPCLLDCRVGPRLPLGSFFPFSSSCTYIYDSPVCLDMCISENISSPPPLLFVTPGSCHVGVSPDPHGPPRRHVPPLLARLCIFYSVLLFIHPLFFPRFPPSQHETTRVSHFGKTKAP